MHRHHHAPGSEHTPAPALTADPVAAAEKALLEQMLAAMDAVPQAPPLQKPIGFRPGEISALINTDVLARHADDAPFLWHLRNQAVAAPHYSLLDLAKLDERVEANLDGLRVA